jgi:hypothetical protein
VEEVEGRVELKWERQSGNSEVVEKNREGRGREGRTGRWSMEQREKAKEVDGIEARRWRG